jgi:hypothetical protein
MSRQWKEKRRLTADGIHAVGPDLEGNVGLGVGFKGANNRLVETQTKSGSTIIKRLKD